MPKRGDAWVTSPILFFLNPKMSTAKASLVALIIALPALNAAAAPSYVLNRLDTSFARDELRVDESGNPYMVDLSGTGLSYAADKNVHGITVGALGWYSGNYRAAAYQGTTKLLDIPFNTAFPSWSVAWAINEKGDVLGGSTAGGYTALQIYTATGEIIGGVGGSYRRPSFNNSWNIVGAGYNEPAFYQDSTGRYELANLVSNLGDFKLSTPTHINEKGMIAGYGIDSDGRVGGFVLNPEVPLSEPGSILLFGFAAAAAALTKSRRREPM